MHSHLTFDNFDSLAAESINFQLLKRDKTILKKT